MNPYVTGAVIKELREKYHLTQAELADERHQIQIEKVEDEYFVRIDHDMTKEHYISFIATMSGDQMHVTKLYPEGNAEVRFNPRGVRKILFYCNQDGLFSFDVITYKRS